MSELELVWEGGVAASLDAIAARDGELNAFIRVADDVRGAAGIPVAIKDNIVTKGTPTPLGAASADLTPATVAERNGVEAT